MASQLCSEVNGGDCKNKVSARNGYVCAAGHGRDSAVRPTIPISNMEKRDKKILSRSTKDEAIQWGLFRTGDIYIRWELSMNSSIGEDLQLELFRTGDKGTHQGLAINSSIGKDIAIGLAKEEEAPHGYTKNKSLAELVQPENLALLNQYPERFGVAYLNRLFLYPQEDKEESKALTLHSYLVYERSGGEHARYYKNKILKRYADDQEVALIISTEPAQ